MGISELQERESGTITRILEGERELFHDLIRPYERSVYLTALSILRNSAEAEDAAQETMLKAYRSLKGFRHEAKFGTWIAAIAVNESRNRLAARTRAAEESLEEKTDQLEGEHTPALLTDWRPVPVEMLEQKELAAKLEQAIAALAPHYREIFTLRDMQHLEVEEVAELLQVSTNLVRVRLHRARLILQKQLVPVLKEHSAPARRWWFRRRL